MTSTTGNLPYASAGTPPPAAEPPSRARMTLLGQALYDTFGQAGARVGAVWIGVLVVVAVFAPFVASSHPIVYRTVGGSLEFPLLRHLTAIDVILVLLLANAASVLVRKPGAGLSFGLIAWPAATVGLVAAAVTWLPLAATLSLYKIATKPPEGVTFGFGVQWVFGLVVHLLAGAAIVLAGWLLVKASVALRRNAKAAGRQRLLVSAVVVAALGLVATFAVRPPENVVYERYREAEKAGQVELAVRTVVPYSANDRLRDRPDEALRSPNRTHWLGTTQYGEDMLARMAVACRVALAIGLIATSISTLIGVTIGGLMGYYAGRLDLIGMRFLEIVEAIPTLILLLIVTVSFGRNLYLMMIVIGLLSWTSDARFVRAEFFRLRNLDFVHAAVAAGLGRTSIIFRHMLPNGVAPVLVNASFGIAGAILLESTLSFLGLGLGPDDPSWGQLLEQARSGGTGFNWWIATFPGLAIFLTVFSYILIGESMRDAIDPKLSKAK